MTTNQTIGGVPRDKLRDLLNRMSQDQVSLGVYGDEVRALLDAPASEAGKSDIASALESSDWAGTSIGNKVLVAAAITELRKAAQPQGEPVAYRYKELQQAWENEKPWELATVALGRVYLERKELAERGVLVGRERETYLGLTVEPLYAEQPAPVAVVLPARPRADEEEYERMTDYEKGLLHGGIELWDKIDEVTRLNPSL